MPNDGDKNELNQYYYLGKWRSKGGYYVAKSRAQRKQKDPEAFRLKEKEKREKYKKSKKVDLSSDEKIAKVREQKGDGRHTAKPSTVAYYRKKIESLARLMNVDNFNADKPTFLKKHKKVIEWVHNRSKNANTQAHYLTCIKSWIQHRKGYEKAFKAYSEAHQNIENPYLSNVGSNKLQDGEEDVKPWVSINKKVEKAIPTLDARGALVAGLYTFFPPRRIKDYALMKITDNEKDLDTDFNYVLLDKKGNVDSFIFNNFKTSSSFGRQKFKIKGKLQHIIQEYIDEQDLKVGEPLISSRGKMIKPNTLTKYIPELFERITGFNISVNDLRKSCISHYLNKNISLNKKKSLAEKMAHSVGTQMLYQRTDI